MARYFAIGMAVWRAGAALLRESADRDAGIVDRMRSRHQVQPHIPDKQQQQQRSQTLPEELRPVGQLKETLHHCSVSAVQYHRFRISSSVSAVQFQEPASMTSLNVTSLLVPVKAYNARTISSTARGFSRAERSPVSSPR